MTDNVVTLPVVTKLDMPPERVLDMAKAKGLTGAVVIGRDQAGDLYFASSIADGGDVLWLMELAKIELLRSASP